MDHLHDAHAGALLEAGQRSAAMLTSRNLRNDQEQLMQLNVPPDLEALINKRLSSGGYTNAEDVLRRALEAQDAEESWTDEERQALSAHIEEGFLQAESGELTNSAQARHDIDAMKEKWYHERSLKQ